MLGEEDGIRGRSGSRLGADAVVAPIPCDTPRLAPPPARSTAVLPRPAFPTKQQISLLMAASTPTRSAILAISMMTH